MLAEPRLFHESSMTLACVEVSGDVYALDVSQIREVVRWQPIRTLPKAPPLISGVVDLRGRVVPVIDVGRALGREVVRETSRARIAIAEVDGLVVGLAVDAALSVFLAAPEDLQDPPALATQAGYDAARGVVRSPSGEAILVLSLETLVESVYRSALVSGEGGS